MLEFYKGKKVFITGHTGFKGSWLTRILYLAGAEITGFALEPPKTFNLFDVVKQGIEFKSIIGDIRDLEYLKMAMEEASPEIVFHLAAQPLVRESYLNPHYTFETNIMGTVNLLEAIRSCHSVKSVVNITTDKVYENYEWEWGYRENDRLNGYDPYSNSKSCSELVTDSYRRSFFSSMNVNISTARAGNVIGGGDYAENRIIPDCIRAAQRGEEILIRNPYSIRPYQHVLESLNAYLMIAEKQYLDSGYQGSYNVGPNEVDCVSTGALAQIFCDVWGNNLMWKNVGENGPHEAKFLKLDSSKIRSRLHWEPKWNISKAIEKTVEWTKQIGSDANMLKVMDMQISDFFIKEMKNEELI